MGAASAASSVADMVVEALQAADADDVLHLAEPLYALDAEKLAS